VDAGSSARRTVRRSRSFECLWRSLRRYLGFVRRRCCLSCLAVIATMAGCGAADGHAPIKIGQQQISSRTLAAFTSAIRAGATLPWLSVEAGTPEQQASIWLIRYQWLVGEAAGIGMPVGSGDAARALQKRGSAFPGGEASYAAALNEAGESRKVAELVALAELAAARVRRKVLNTVVPVTENEIQLYYWHHLSRYRMPEQRAYNFGERIDGPRELADARRAIVNNYTVKKPSDPYEVEIKLTLDHPHGLPAGEERAVARAIFAAKPDVVVGPFHYHGHESLFKVDEVIPSHLTPLSKVKRNIARQLHQEAITRSATEFISVWRARWSAQTRCIEPYVVSGCREYQGPQIAETDLLSPE
jgi:PPIC-type PPIASE domain